MAVLRAAEPVTLNASQLLSRGSRGRKPDAASSLSPRAQPVRRSYLVPSSYAGSAGQVPEMHGASRADPDLEHLMKTSRDEDDIKAAAGDDGSGLWDQQELSALRTSGATSAPILAGRDFAKNVMSVGPTCRCRYASGE